MIDLTSSPPESSSESPPRRRRRPVARDQDVEELFAGGLNGSLALFLKRRREARESGAPEDDDPFAQPSRAKKRKKTRRQEEAELAGMHSAPVPRAPPSPPPLRQAAPATSAAKRATLYSPPRELWRPLDVAHTKPWSNAKKMLEWVGARKRTDVTRVGGFDIGCATPSIAHLCLEWDDAGELASTRIVFGFSEDMRRGWKPEGANSNHDALVKRQIEANVDAYRAPHLLTVEYQERVNLSNVMIEKGTQEALPDSCVVVSAKLAKEAYPDMFVLGGYDNNKRDARELARRILTERELKTLEAALAVRKERATARRLERAPLVLYNKQVDEHNKMVDRMEKAHRKSRAAPVPPKRKRRKSVPPTIDTDFSHLADATILAFTGASFVAGRDIIRERLAVRAARLSGKKTN